MKIVLFANTEWYLYNFRRSLALALKDAGHDVLLISPPGPYGKRLEELGFRWLAAPMQRQSLNPLREIALVFWLWRLFRREKVDHVHSFTIKCAVYGSLAARLAGIPGRVNAVVGMGYVFISSDLKARLLRPVVRMLMRVALGGQGSCLILQNPDDVAFFKELAIVPSELIRLIPGSGVDCYRFSLGDASNKTKLFRVLLAGRLIWDKGLFEYVEAVRQVKNQRYEIEFYLAGSPDPGNPAAVPEEIVQGWCNEGLISWLHHVDDMPPLYRSMDVVVLPSYREGLPKSLIEAAACGLALVTTDVPGCREVVTDGVDGLIIPVHDSKALAVAIIQLYDDPQLGVRFGLAAREKALRLFDEKIVIEQTVGVYAELV